MYYDDKENAAIQSLVGETIILIEGMDFGSDCVSIHTASGKCFSFYHQEDCCETVDLNDYEADVETLCDGLIISAEIATNDEWDEPGPTPESWTWTFYKIETTKGEIWMRWLGDSNGHYSEKVKFSCRQSKLINAPH